MMHYRKDIDGIRAVAVLVVILHHLKVTGFSGGFIGVDVFFVISGFLISSIIYQQIQEGRFTIRNFYRRRILRLMPALFFVLFASTAVFSLVLLPSDLLNYAKSLIWVNFHVGNVFFWQYNGGYFAENNLETPLLHTWSLAVEEQYYLVWPAYMILGFRYLSNRTFIIFSAVLLVLSILVSHIGTLITFGAGYYLLPTRIFELMIGSLLAISWPYLPRIHPWAQHVISVLGMVMVLYASVTFTEFHPFPGLYALIPTLGTAMLILSAQGVVNRVLGFAPIVFVGLISYSMYLVHWPVIALHNYLAIELDSLVTLQILVFTFVAAYFSWRFVEKPFRGPKGMSTRHVFTYLYILPTLCFVGLASVYIVNDGFPKRFDNDILLMQNAMNSYPELLRAGCHHAMREGNLPPDSGCRLGSGKNGATTGFMFGDSHANHFTGFVDVLGKQFGFRTQDYTMDQCPPVFDLYWGTNKFRADACKARNDSIRQYLQEKDFDFVIMSAAWPREGTQMLLDGDERIEGGIKPGREFQRQLTATIAWLIEQGMYPLILLDTPALKNVNSNCLLKKELFNADLDCINRHTPNRYMADLGADLEVFFPRLTVLDSRYLICEGDRCQTSLEHIPLYRDDDHLNDVGSRMLAGVLIERYLEETDSSLDKFVRNIAPPGD